MKASILLRLEYAWDLSQKVVRGKAVLKVPAVIYDESACWQRK